MKRAALVAPVRTAVGRFGGALRDVPAESLAATVVKETVRRSGIDPSRIDDVAMGQSYANSEAPCIGRWAALEAGLPISVAGFQTDRRCGTGLQAIVSAAMMVQTGAADVVLAGGVESMSGIEHYTTGARWGTRSGGLQLFDRLDRGRTGRLAHTNRCALGQRVDLILRVVVLKCFCWWLGGVHTKCVFGGVAAVCPHQTISADAVAQVQSAGGEIVVSEAAFPVSAAAEAATGPGAVSRVLPLAKEFRVGHHRLVDALQLQLALRRAIELQARRHARRHRLVW